MPGAIEKSCRSGKNLALAALALLPMPAMADIERGCTALDRGDFQAARKQWEPLAQRGHAQSQFRLGCLYTFGQGVPEDHVLALRLFRRAAEPGDADAQNNLGGMNAEGVGVAADQVEAYMWFELAASTGHETAIRSRAYPAEGMSAAQVAQADTRARSWRAAHPEAGRLRGSGAASRGGRRLYGQSRGHASATGAPTRSRAHHGKE